MKIFVRVKAHSRECGVEKTGPNQFQVRVKAPPREGKANQAVIETLALHFGVPKSRVTILSGLKSNQKIVNIED